jgi:hypothetical protein
MPFDEEDNDQQSVQSGKLGLKKVSSQKSIFDSIPKKTTPDEFERNVKKVQERVSNNKSRAADLAFQFNKAMQDKTLPQNRNMFQQDMERDLLKQMVELAVIINNDGKEQEGMGSLSWITILLRTCFSQRDKNNVLEYRLSQLEKKLDSLDKPKKSE